MEAFDEEWHHGTDALRVVNVTGVGGIGKSRFLRECQQRVGDSAVTAHLDLQIPALREPDAALAVLRSQFGKAGLSFPRYDIAYLALWQRLHPHLRVALADIADDRESDVLQDLVESAAGVPVFRTVMGLLTLVDGASARLRRWRWLRRDETLRQLDSLDVGDLADAVTFLFAEDLRASCGARRPLLCVDAYEALVEGNARAGRTAGRDSWLRDLVAQLRPGLVLMASREPLHWESYDTGWAGHVRLIELGGLPRSATLQLLSEGGVRDAGLRSALAEASAGMPFYLNLALDAATQHENPDIAVSGEELLERFLQHVHPTEVRLLEVLAAARIVDFHVFETVSSVFDLPRDRISWERLVRYSFVQPAGAGQFQLHQLMATALRQRQSEHVHRTVHHALERLWSGRAETPGSDPMRITAALREALYHAMHAGRVDAGELLRRSDAIAEAGGVWSLSGVVEDVRGYCRMLRQSRPDLQIAAHCVEAEAALLGGDPQRAAELTSRFPQQATGDPARVRLSLAAADAQRILGNTAEALARYVSVWRFGAGRQQATAGLWAADLYMATGRFHEAEELAATLAGAVPPDNHRMHGDIARLLHLARRFSFDLDGSRRALDDARERYRLAGSTIGLGQLTVNEAELLAWSTPGLAEPIAVEAIRAQELLGAWHELGKAWTARALAALRLGRLVEAEQHLEAAFESLGRARYRSGMARAQLVRTFLLLRQGDHNGARRAALIAVREFEETEVYPTLILTAAASIRQAGLEDREFTGPVERARRRIRPVGTLQALEFRLAAWAASLHAGSS